MTGDDEAFLLLLREEWRNDCDGSAFLDIPITYFKDVSSIAFEARNRLAGNALLSLAERQQVLIEAAQIVKGHMRRDEPQQPPHNPLPPPCPCTQTAYQGGQQPAYQRVQPVHRAGRAQTWGIIGVALAVLFLVSIIASINAPSSTERAATSTAGVIQGRPMLTAQAATAKTFTVAPNAAQIRATANAFYLDNNCSYAGSSIDGAAGGFGDLQCDGPPQDPSDR